LSDLTRVLLDQLARVQERVATILGRDVGPNLERILRGLDRLLDVLVISLRHGIDRRAGGGIADFGCVLGYGIDGFAADKHLGH